MKRVSRGFTLVELLIGMTILLVVVTGVHTSFSVGLRARERARERTEQLQTLRTVTGQINDDIHNLVPIRPAIAIQAESIDLLRYGRTSEGAGLDSPSLVRVHYRVERDDDEVACVRETIPVEWSVTTGFDPIEALGWESRDGALVPASESGATAVETWRAAATNVRWRGLQPLEGTLTDAPWGVPSDIRAIRFELGVSSADSLDHRFTLYLPPGGTP